MPHLIYFVINIKIYFYPSKYEEKELLFDKFIWLKISSMVVVPYLQAQKVEEVVLYLSSQHSNFKTRQSHFCAQEAQIYVKVAIFVAK